MRPRISLLDFAPLAGSDWYAALRDAIAYLTTLGGGRLVVPSRGFAYQCNVTTAIPITSDGITIEGDGPAVALENTSPSGVDFFQLSGSGGRHHFNLRDIKIKSDVSAGHIVNVVTGGMTFCRWNAEFAQLNPAKSILKAAITEPGLFDNEFTGGPWEHGVGATRTTRSPTVPAVDVSMTTNSFSENIWRKMRVHAHGGWVPFFRFQNDNPSNGPFNNNNGLHDLEVEVADGGLAYLTGQSQFSASNITFYDDNNIDRHLFELANGANGRNNEQCIFTNIRRNRGSLVGVADTNQSATFTSSGTTVTVTVATTAHGKAVGQRIYVTGDITQRATVVSVPAPNKLTFVADTTPPASGSLTLYTAAMDVKVGDSDARHTFLQIGGTPGAAVEVDLANRSALVLGDHERVTFYRVSPRLTTLIGKGTEARVDTPTLHADAIDERTADAGITLLEQNIKAVHSFTVPVNLPSVAALGNTRATVTAPGVRLGDRLVFHPNESGPDFPSNALIIGVPFISADDKITIPIFNPTAGTIDSSERTWHGMVWRFG